MTLMTLYMVCVALGGVLMGTSIFLGGDGDHDADVDHDVDLGGDIDAGGDLDLHGDVDAHADVDLHGDVDAHADVDAGHADIGHHGGGFEWSVLPFGSLRFWTFLVESFGLTGALLSCAGIPSGATLGIALASGGLVGWGAFTFFRWLAREEVSGAVALHDYANSEARVMVRIPADAVGKIVIENGGGRIELMARSMDGIEIRRGAIVLVVGVKDGEAQVTRLKEAPDTLKEEAAQRAARRQVEKQL